MTYVLIILAGLSGDSKAAVAHFADQAHCEAGKAWAVLHRGVDAVCLPEGKL